MGRPKKGEEYTPLKPFAIRFPEDLLNKAKYIAWHDRKAGGATGIITAALQDLVRKWEKANEPITPELIKKMEETR